jgi:hypothetical protein
MPARALLAAALLTLATAANAVSVDSVGDAFSVSFDGNVETQPVAGLSASASFLVTEFDAASGHVVLQITLSNTTDAALWQGARVSAIGFDVSSPIVSAAASGLFSFAVTGSKFPNQFGAVDVCAIDNPNNCSGGQNGGIEIGENGVVTMTLDFAGPITSLELANFGVRYQSLDSEELGLEGDSGTGTGTVPEPRLLALLGAAGLALLGRKRRS